MAKKEKQVIKMSDFVKMLSAKSGFTQASINELLHGFDDTLKIALEQVTKDSDVEIHVTPNIKFINTYKEGSIHRSFATGELEKAPNHFQTKVRLGKDLKRVGDAK